MTIPPDTLGAICLELEAASSAFLDAYPDAGAIGAWAAEKAAVLARHGLSDEDFESAILDAAFAMEAS